MYKFFATLIQTRKIVITNHVPFSVICTDIQFLLKSFARVRDTIIYYYYYYISFCKGRTIPNKSLSLEIFIYLLCFRDVLYLEGRSCALPSSGSLLIYPVFPLCVNSICPFPRVISDVPNISTSVLLLNLKPKKLQGCFLTSFSVSITFIKTNIAISLNILKYTQRTTSCHSRLSTAAKYFALVNLVSQLPTGVKTLGLLYVIMLQASI